ncbi:MAG TPA: hypothetical protein VGS21_06610, partial [Acidimicrobiales bacterium]|nr:hypothetical protein [Acidimicrobiales bacterium]
GRLVYLIAVSLRQPDGLYGAGRSDLAMLDAATKVLALYQVIARGAVVGHVKVPWGSASPEVSVASQLSVVGWPGMTLKVTVLSQVNLPPASTDTGQAKELLAPGTVVGSLVLSADGGLSSSEDLQLAGAVSEPPPGWNPG